MFFLKFLLSHLTFNNDKLRVSLVTAEAFRVAAPIKALTETFADT